MSCLYLSPHLDDAVWSCAGLMMRQRAAGRPFAVATMFTASSVWEYVLHYEKRREEDQAALERAGGAWLHMGFTETPYWHEPASSLPDRKQAQEAIIQSLAYFNPSVLYVPLGIGDHRHHLFLRSAVEALPFKPRVIYYEDRPYVFSRNPKINPLMKAVDTVRVDPSAFGRLCKLIGSYRSQLQDMSWDAEGFVRAGLEYNSERGEERGFYIERYWGLV